MVRMAYTIDCPTFFGKLIALAWPNRIYIANMQWQATALAVRTDNGTEQSRVRVRIWRRDRRLPDRHGDRLVAAPERRSIACSFAG